jgi:hypothetical protein
LFNSGNKRLLAALSDSIANGIPSLARASIITVAWMASFLHVVGDENLHFMACSTLMPRLLESLDYNKDLEERVLASYSLLCLFKSSGVKSFTLSESTFLKNDRCIIKLFLKRTARTIMLA